MFHLDDRHYAAIFLHPRYYSAMGEYICNNTKKFRSVLFFLCLEYWNREEKQSTNRFIKRQLQSIIDETKSSLPPYTDNNLVITTPKRKRRRTDDIFSEYSSPATESHGKRKNNGLQSEDNNQYDELLNYKTIMLKEKGSQQQEDPLLWWKSNETAFPMLSLLASMFYLVINHKGSFYFVGGVFSIPVTLASVERQFSQAGLVYSDRRTRIKPSLLNDILLVRSKYKIGTNYL